MPESDLKNEINRINGALGALGLMRELLLLQRDELGAESGREAVDEMLTRVDALQIEYQRRRMSLHPHHRSYQFYLTDAGVVPVFHEAYVALTRGEAVAASYAGRTLRIADWYVRMEEDVPKQVVNETYAWVVIDATGRADLHAGQAIDSSPLPRTAERQEIEKLLFSSRA